MYFELDGAQAAPFAAELERGGACREVITRRDYAGIDRLVGGRTGNADAGKPAERETI